MARPARKHPVAELTQLVAEVTYRCPSRCLFCYNAWHGEYSQEPELSVEQYRSLAEKLPPARYIVISGGEPLVREDVFEIMDALAPVSRMFTFLTSGQIMTPALAGKLARPDVRVQLPIHGLQKTHDRLTGVKGGFKKALEAIGMLAEAGALYSNAFVVNAQNIGEFERMLETSVALGTDSLFAIRFLPGGRGLQNTELMLSVAQTERMLEILDDVAGRYGLPGMLGVPNVPCVIDEKRFKHIQFHGCTAGVDWFTMDPSGRLRVCNHSPTVVGDLRKQTFAQIWKNPLLECLRNNELLPPRCRTCEKRTVCRGGCRAVAETMFGDWSGPDPLMLEPKNATTVK
jgi:radical SAM protein with 4Fe4S-binding SPASM domain